MKFEEIQHEKDIADVKEVKAICIAGVFIGEHGTEIRYRPFFHDSITKVLAPSFHMSVPELWHMIADDLRRLATEIEIGLIEVKE